MTINFCFDIINSYKVLLFGVFLRDCQKIFEESDIEGNKPKIISKTRILARGVGGKSSTCLLFSSLKIEVEEFFIALRLSIGENNVDLWVFAVYYSINIYLCIKNFFVR